MKSLKIVFIPILLSLGSFCVYAQDQYAPWAEFNNDIPEGMRISYGIMKLHTPDRNMIELPPYPGAEIIESSQSTGSVDDSRDPYLPTVTLISSDSVTKIINVYKDIITDFPGWHWNSKFSIFYKGNLRDALNGHSPYVQIRAINTDEPDLIYLSSNELESVNSRIIVCYAPGSILQD